MYELSGRLPLKILRKHRGNRTDIEALCFGVAGLLNAVFADAYPAQLKIRFDHLSHKYGLTPMPATFWKWKSSRPANFPSIRISQFSGFLERNVHLLSGVLACAGTDDLERLFKGNVSPYFCDHFRFDVPSTPGPRNLGMSSVNQLLINAVLPCLFSYAVERGLASLQEKVIGYFDDIAPETNRITRKWVQLGMPNTSAGQSQGLIQLKKAHCDHQHCLRCAIGNIILADSVE